MVDQYPNNIGKVRSLNFVYLRWLLFVFKNCFRYFLLSKIVFEIILLCFQNHVFRSHLTKTVRNNQNSCKIINTIYTGR